MNNDTTNSQPSLLHASASGSPAARCAAAPSPLRRSRWLLFFDVAVLLLAILLLFSGSARQMVKDDSDAAKYQCYAVAFWHGFAALDSLPHTQCLFMTHPAQTPATPSNAEITQMLRKLNFPAPLLQLVADQSPSQAYHALPHEYPFLAVFLFSAGLLAPPAWYQFAFACAIALIAGIIYVLLLRRSRGAALAYLLFLVLGNWATALGRFDLALAACTLLALLCAERGRWKLAFLLLALATLLKFYPVVLVVPFLSAQLRQDGRPWYAWRRFVPLALFMATCALVMLGSLLLSVAGTLGPLGYFGGRPVQIESLLASLLRLFSSALGYPLQYAYTYGSRNVFGQLSSPLSLLASLLFVLGLLTVYWLHWRAKIQLSLAVLLVLLVILCTGKVFSAQYLLWVTPLVAYVGGWRWRWLCGWGCICFLTTLIYPFLYARTDYSFGQLLPDFFTTILLRNLLLLALTCLVLYWSTHNQTRIN